MNKKLSGKISKLILETQLQHKHDEKRKLLRENKDLLLKIKREVGYILRMALFYVIGKTVQRKHKGISQRHKVKLTNLRLTQLNTIPLHRQQFIKSIIHNYSDYQLSDDEKTALSFSLDENIPFPFRSNQVNTEFEMFYQNLLRNVSHIPEAQKSRLKTKVRNACDKYSRLKTPYKYRNIIKNLQTNQNIVILKQDKGRGVVIMNRDKYMDKCIDILNTEQFKKLNKDSTSTLENKVQRLVRKIKSKIPVQLYSKIYPTGSQPAKFYGTAKVHKVPEGGSLDQLPLRPIVANTSSATYHLAKYLAKLLSPLCTSEYTIQSTADFIKKIKEEKVPEGFQLVSFDVKSLFTSVPLEDTIEIILHRIYDNNEICTEISRDEMKSLLILCTKNVIFSFNNNIYIQTDGVAMGSPLGPVLAGICMVELEREIIPS